MIIRPYRPTSDLDALADLYAQAVRVLGVGYYDPEQVEVWASWPDDRAAFSAFLAEGLTLVVEIDDAVAALGQLNPNHHVALLYTHPDFARRGCATALLSTLESHARAAGVERLYTDASKVSRTLFENAGFKVIAQEEVSRQGVTFTRFRMGKVISG